MSKIEFRPTAEQVAIERLFNRADHPNIKVVARAGSGKTTCSRYLAESTSRKGCYLAFGTKNAAEAKAKFPKDMLVKTTHALAYAAMNVREQWGHKLKNDSNKWPLWQVVQQFGIREYCGISAMHLAHAALQGMRNFCYSADAHLTADHVTDRSKDAVYFTRYLLGAYRKKHDVVLAPGEQHFIAHSVPQLQRGYQEQLLNTARALWEAQISTSHPFPLEHDTYLKLWQLSKPIIPNIEYLIADECQDSNSCVLDILMNQLCQLIFIGDPAQGIYNFRKARNILDDFDALLCYLSLSFRFGPAIAHVANQILLLAYPDLVPIRGNPQRLSVVGDITEGRYALVARTNAGLFDEAVALACAGTRFHVVGSLRDPIERARSAYHLWAGNLNQVKHPDMKPYDDWASLQTEAQYDVDLSRYVRMVTAQESRVLTLCEVLQQAGEVPAKQAEVVLTTVHKSKGLEYPQVRLANDFGKLKVDDQGKVYGPQEEIHVLYVGATRAEQRLELNSIAEAAVRQHGITEPEFALV